MPIFQGQFRTIQAQRFYVGVMHPAKVETRYVDGKQRRFRVPSGDIPLQITAYTAYIELTANSAQYAIFPVPLSQHRNRFRYLHAFPTELPGFFTDLELLFPMAERTTLQRSVLEDLDVSDRLNITSAKIGRSFADLVKLGFITDDTIASLKQYYAEGYAFLVVEFCAPPMGSDERARSSGWLGPIAYVHELIGLPKTIQGQRVNLPRLYVPTHHYLRAEDVWTEKYSYKASDLRHDNPFDAQTETLAGNDDRMLQIHHRRRAPLELLPVRGPHREVKPPPEALISARMPVQPESPWDHHIYVLGAARVERNPLFRHPGTRVTPAKERSMEHVRMYLNPQKMPKEICYGEIRSMHRIEIDASYRYKLDLWL